MKKIIHSVLLCMLIGGIVYAQNAQVSPVADLNKDNTAVVNNNFQQVQTGLNNTLGFFSKYFTNSILNTANGGTGQDFSAVPANNIFYSSSIGHFGNIGIGTFGQPLIFGNPPRWGSWGPSNIQVFSTPGTATWTKPASVSSVYVKVWGGGGQGSCRATPSSSSGGASGGYSEGIITVTGNVTVTVGIGGGGCSGTQTGGDGATSSFAGSTTIQATGGTGGTNSGSGGTPGVGSNGSVNLTGTAGQAGDSTNSFGSGAGAPFGGGSTYFSGSALVNQAGNSPGGGSNAGNAASGGGNGMVIVYY